MQFINTKRVILSETCWTVGRSSTLNIIICLVMGCQLFGWGIATTHLPIVSGKGMIRSKLYPGSVLLDKLNFSQKMTGERGSWNVINMTQSIVVVMVSTKKQFIFELFKMHLRAVISSWCFSRSTWRSRFIWLLVSFKVVILSSLSLVTNSLVFVSWSAWKCE